MQELIKGLRGELIDCKCYAYSASECGCDCTWPEHVASKAADLIESQAAEIASIQETLDAVAKVASDAENLVISQRDEIATLKLLCDQMGNALEEVTALALCGKKDQLPGRCDQITKIAYKTLKAWRAMKSWVAHRNPNNRRRS